MIRRLCRSSRRGNADSTYQPAEITVKFITPNAGFI
jgi:hypothetical protein